MRERRADYVRQDPLFRELYGDPKARLASAEDLLQSMDDAQVDVAVVLNLAWSSHQLCLLTNDYLLEEAERYPRRLVPFCMACPKEPERAVAEIERCAALGARGIGELRSEAQGFTLADQNIMTPLVEAAERLNLILLTHVSEPVGHSYPGKRGTTVESVYGFLTKFSRTRVICAHWGGGLPFYAHMPEVERAFSTAYVDTAASSFLYKKQVFRMVKDLIGSEKVLFGSDYPLISQRRALEHVRRAGLTPEDQLQILGENAVTLLGLKVPT
jgi:predicted TIM-barrel fold metal-dependent hydrolase